MGNLSASPSRSHHGSPLEFRRRGGFNIASTNPSAYYDRTVLATLFQDSAGTTPVTAGSQPIGLGLDQSQGLVLGPELWTPESSYPSQAGGSVGVWDAATRTFSNDIIGTNPGYPTLNTTLIAGATYQVDVLITGDIGSVTSWYLHGVGNGLEGAIVNGVLSAVLTPKNTGELAINFNGTTVFSCVVNLSIKTLAGNHQSQATAGKRPLTSGSPIYADFDADDELITTFPASLGSGCTVCRSLPGTGASITTGVTLTATFTDNVDAHFLAIYTAAQWAALDAGQIANITALLNAKAGL